MKNNKHEQIDIPFSLESKKEIQKNEPIKKIGLAVLLTNSSLLEIFERNIEGRIKKVYSGKKNESISTEHGPLPGSPSFIKDVIVDSLSEHGVKVEDFEKQISKEDIQKVRRLFYETHDRIFNIHNKISGKKEEFPQDKILKTKSGKNSVTLHHLQEADRLGLDFDDYRKKFNV